MTPKRPIGAGAIPDPVESPAPSLPDGVRRFTRRSISARTVAAC